MCAKMLLALPFRQTYGRARSSAGKILPSHGRGPRFNPWRAHHHFRRKAGISPTGGLPRNHFSGRKRSLCTPKGVHYPCTLRPNLGNVMPSIEIGVFPRNSLAERGEHRPNGR